METHAITHSAQPPHPDRALGAFNPAGLNSESCTGVARIPLPLPPPSDRDLQSLQENRDLYSAPMTVRMPQAMAYICSPLILSLCVAPDPLVDHVPYLPMPSTACAPIAS